MSEGTAAAFRASTLARFEAHRQAWQSNEALRLLYGRWYGRVKEQLPAQGPWVELGSGPGFARDFIPEMELTDVVQAPWHDRQVDASALPFAAGSVGALVLFDVLHHLPAPARFFAEAERVLRPGGRLVVCEPYVSPLSYPVYRFFHEERLEMGVDPLAEGPAGDPFDANQAIPTLLFARRPDELARRFPALRLCSLERLAGPAYPAAGGFSRGPLLPLSLWRALLAVEDLLPAAAFRLVGFRMLAVLERR
jgi:SAM-dependent methyltransferase